MAFQILLNLSIAFVWMLLNNSWRLLDFGIGYFIGLFLLYALRNFLNRKLYYHRLLAAVLLGLIFIREMILSNIIVMKQVLSPKLTIKPGIIAMPVEVKNPWEIILLANLISLTPGTLSVDLSPENDYLYIHAMDVPDAEAMIASLKDTFERRILEVFRDD